MKIEFEEHDDAAILGAISDLTAAMVVHRLKASLVDLSKEKLPADRAYYKKYNEAAKIVIKYFGGKV